MTRQAWRSEAVMGGIGQHLMALRLLGRSLVGLALDQDGPVRVSAVGLDALAGRDSERGGIQLLDYVAAVTALRCQRLGSPVRAGCRGLT